MTIQEDRSFDIFVTDLRRKAEYCDFGAIKDSLIRDQIVVGINDPKLRERLLRKTDLTLEKAIKLCRITEQSQEQSKIFISPTTQTGIIAAVKKEEPLVDTAKSKNKDSKDAANSVQRPMTGEIVQPMELHATNAMEEITMQVLLQIEKWHGRKKSSSRGSRGA